MARWVDGRPLVNREKTVHLLHVRSGPSEIDLIQVLADQGFVVNRGTDGSIDCVRPVATPPAQRQARPVLKVSGTKPDPTFKSQCAPAQFHEAQRQRQEWVQLVGEAVAAQCRRPTTWTFTVVEHNEPNAYTPGEGQVFITTGLLRLKLTEDELAGVLGHEIAHGARHHQEFRNLHVDRANQALARLHAAHLEVLRARRDASAEAQRLSYRLKNLAQAYSSEKTYFDHEQSFNHAAELEADAFGLDYCTAAGFRADGILTALQKMRNHKDQQDSRSHPALSRRIERIQTLLRQRGQ